jgi:cell division protein FtsN
MSEPKSRLFIYDRKEMAVLLLLAVMVALFAFTLGVHLGKRIGPKGFVSESASDAAPVTTAADKVPNRLELTEQGKGVAAASDEALNQALHDEVARTGVKLDTTRQVELPDETRSANAGATTTAPRELVVKGKAAEDAAPVAPLKAALSDEESFGPSKRQAPPGKYTLQVGSYPAFAEARDQAESLEALGLSPFLRSVNLKKRGRWFRVYLGGFETMESAEEAGARYRSKNMIESFVVANRVE